MLSKTVLTMNNCTLESVLEDNQRVLELAQKHKQNYVLIDEEYKVDIDL